MLLENAKQKESFNNLHMLKTNFTKQYKSNTEVVKLLINYE